MHGSYYAEKENDAEGNFIRKGPQSVPQKQPGKKRIAIMGDSLGSDDDKWGWAPHLGYLVSNH